MTPKARQAEADRIYAIALFLEGDGQVEEALAHLYAAAGMGDVSAQCHLADLLADKVEPPRMEEAGYWYRRAVAQGSAMAAWNYAMTFRRAGSEMLFWAWLRKAALMGDDDANVILDAFPSKRRGRVAEI